MQARLVVLLAWLTLALPLDVQADGKVFSQVTAVKTVTPDQRALLHYANGIETLVVETTFVGAGTNFAWVVPLPAAPEITAVPRTVFTNLEMLFRPEIIHKQTAWWIGMVLLLILGGILLRWPNAQVRLVPALLCVVGFLLLLAFFSLLLLQLKHRPGPLPSRSASKSSAERSSASLTPSRSVLRMVSC